VNEKSNVREWLFRALMFEAECDKYKSAGIRIGADTEISEKALMEDVLSLFSIPLRNEALMMARIYVLMNCFENSVRELIKERLREKYDERWWDEGVPDKIKTFASKRQKDARENSWLEGENIELLEFVDFGHLADIIIQNWTDFQFLIPTQAWLKQRMDELEKARNFIAHNRFLSQNEFRRIEQYIGDWNKQIGF